MVLIFSFVIPTIIVVASFLLQVIVMGTLNRLDKLVSNKLVNLSIKYLKIALRNVLLLLRLVRWVCITISSFSIVGIAIISLFVVILMGSIICISVSFSNNTSTSVDSNGVSQTSTLESTESTSNTSNTSKRDHWIKSVSELADWYADNVITYQTGTDGKAYGSRKSYPCDLLEGKNVMDDCSAFATACLSYAGYYDEYTGDSAFLADAFNTEDALACDILKKAGFKFYKASELTGDDLKCGDILARNSHVEIFSNWTSDNYMVSWTWGAIYTSEPATKGTTKDSFSSSFEGVWRLE